MSGSVNKVILVGNLGQDPEVRRTQDGKPVVTMSIATSDSWRDKSTGERKERTEWHRVVVFNEGLAKVAEQYLKKGMKVYVEGKQRTRRWDKDGEDRYTTETTIEAFSGSLHILTPSGRSAPSESDYGTTRTSSAGGGRDDMNDDIPF